MRRGNRRLLSSLNLSATLLLISVLFILVNFVASRRYVRWDFTKQKITALSDKTIQTLKSLKEPVNITVFYQSNHRLFEPIKDALEEYARVNPMVRLVLVDPDQDAALAKQIANQFQLTEGNVVIFQAGPRHKYLDETEVAEYDYTTIQSQGGPRLKAFKGEDAFTSAIINVTQTTSPTIWFTTGHGEKSAESTEQFGLSDLKTALDQQNLTVKPVALLEQSAVPADVKLIIIPGPTRRFTETEVAMLETYLEKGGSALILLDPKQDSGLDGLLMKWGIEVGMDIVVDPARRLPFVSAANLFVTNYSQHPIVEKMKTLMTLFPLARSMRPAEPTPAGLRVTRLALTSDQGWGETKTDVETFEFNEGQDLKGPVPIAVAAERARDPRTRLVAIGDSDFLINGQLGNVGNKDFLFGAVYWLLEQEQLIGIRAKPIESIKLGLTGKQLIGLFWFSFLGMPLVCGVLGIGMWFVRRK